MQSDIPLVHVSLLTTSSFHYLILLLTNLWQQQQLLRPSLLRSKVETFLLLLIHRDCSHTAMFSPSMLFRLFLPVFVQGVLSIFSLCFSEMQDLSMESGIDPGQDYYSQDYYNYDQG